MDPSRHPDHDDDKDTGNTGDGGDGHTPDGNGGARGTHCVLVARWVLRAAARSGVDADAIAAECGLAGISLDHFENRLTADELLGLWEVVMHRTRDPALPVTAPPRSFAEQRSLAVLSAMTAATFGEALRDGAAHSGTWSTTYALELHDDCPDGVSLRARGLGTERLGERCEAEYTLADVLNAARVALGPTVQPTRVSFRHRPPHDIRAHREWFGPGLRFDDEHTEIVFARELLDLPLGTAQPDLHTLIERQLITAGLEQPTSPTVAEAARAALCAGLADGALRAADVAAALHMSERTLHRRLAAEGVHLHRLLDDVRRQQALDLLGRTDLATKEIAAALGFASARSFHRAFRRWTGSTPRQAIPRRP
jgi:AraC-like DNA-binding protein